MVASEATRQPVDLDPDIARLECANRSGVQTEVEDDQESLRQLQNAVAIRIVAVPGALLPPVPESPKSTPLLLE